MIISARTHKKQWAVYPADKDKATELAQALKVSSVLAQVLINRGITDIAGGNDFLRPKLTSLLAPESMPGIVSAVERIKQAIVNQESITIYGDYDVDGITGVAILQSVIKLLGGQADFYIPHRIDEGYGLHTEAIRSIIASGCDLLVTVDCGVTAFDSAKLAREHGLDMIITDHHQFFKEVPEVFAVVHPGLEATYLNQDSSGSMVAFKLAWAIANEFKSGDRLSPALRDFMLNATSLASMGTIADVMDLRGENRILTSYGLKALAQSPLAGIEALIETARLGSERLDSYHIGFRLAPMLNAAGRMGHARLAVELMTTDNKSRALHIAEYLKDQNNKRRACERKIFKHACELISERGLNHPDRKSIVLWDEKWHGGVIGIVASRLAEKYHRPVILLNSGQERAQGSARSIEGFNILQAIESASSVLAGYGGHTMAAGVTIDRACLNRFAEMVETYTQRFMAEAVCEPKMHIDAVVSLASFTDETVNQLQLLEPFGQGNPRPLFATKGVTLTGAARRVGSKNEHLQFAVRDHVTSLRCIGFGMGKYEKKLHENDYFDIAYEPQMNHFNGSSHVQLVVRDIQFE